MCLHSRSMRGHSDTGVSGVDSQKHNAGLMVDRRHRRRASIKSTLGERLMFSGSCSRPEGRKRRLVTLYRSARKYLERVHMAMMYDCTVMRKQTAITDWPLPRTYAALTHSKYASEYNEYESLKFAVNSPKSFEYIANIFTSVIPRPLVLTNISQTHCECLPMPYELLTIIANGAIILKKCCDCLTNVMNACECLQMGLQTLQNYLWMMWMSYQRYHCPAIFLRIIRIFDDETAIHNAEWTFVA